MSLWFPSFLATLKMVVSLMSLLVSPTNHSPNLYYIFLPILLFSLYAKKAGPSTKYYYLKRPIHDYLISSEKNMLEKAYVFIDTQTKG